MEAHRTVLRVVTEAVNDQFCCLLYLAILLKCEHHLFLKAGDGGRGGGGGREGKWKGGRVARGEGEDEGARMPRNGLLYLCLLTLAWSRQQLGFWS